MISLDVCQTSKKYMIVDTGVMQYVLLDRVVIETTTITIRKPIYPMTLYGEQTKIVRRANLDQCLKSLKQ